MAGSNWNSNNNKNYNNGNSNSNNSGNKGEQRKKSGCQKGIGRIEGKKWVSGWNKSSQGFLKFLAFEYKDTKQVTSRNGKIWETWVARVTFPDRKVELKPVLCEVMTGRIFFRDMNMIANPNAPNGGYFGRMVRKNR
jgi:hypothetical protein